jgi:Zn-dependent M28 family amino/carboxypeptidase
MRLKLVLSALAAVLIASGGFFYLSWGAQPPHLQLALSAARYMKDVIYLSRDEMMGRGNGSPELEQAADHIGEQFLLAGLAPGGENDSYFQSYAITTGAELGPDNALSIAGRAFALNQDFVPILFSSTADVDAPLVFAGYGITAPALKYDDYAGIDAKGKIVVVFQQEPQYIDPKSRFAAAEFGPYLSFVNKAINASRHGAKAIVFITEPSVANEDIGTATRQEPESDMGIPAVHAKRAVFMALFAARGHDLAALQKRMDAEFQPQSFATPDITAHIATDIVRSRKTIRNVIAALPGSDPTLKNQWVVIGAHYDHLGLGNRNSLAPSQIGQIHHGADDNASGTAGVIELARVLASGPPLRRSVLFIAFSGEEIGALGSSWFVNHPTVPLQSIDAMINLDMIGRLRNDKLFIGGVGTSPNLKPMIEDFNKQARFAITYSESGYGASDHISFTVKKIPVLFFFSGLHTDYHKPSDTYDKINAPGAIRILGLVDAALTRLANEGARLPFSEVKGEQPMAREGGRGYGPWFGSVPDFRDDIVGVLFSDVEAGSPAAKAGLKAGDTLIEFDGKPIRNLNEYAFALRTKKPGDIVPVVVKRSGADVHADVRLEERK